MTPCILANSQQVNDPNSPGMILTYIDQQPTYAQIMSVGSVAFLLGQSTEIGQITHKAVMRWTDFNNVTMFSFLLRDRLAPDQSRFQQIFKIHRVLESDGLEWWIEVELELQQQAAP
jgi:hypothetical protein